MHKLVSRVLGLGGALVALLPLASQASSHREAPLITAQPKVDGTDFYMFRSYEKGRDGFVTLVADYLPLQDAYGGPNYFQLDQRALYEIHVSNGGRPTEDLTFRFRFRNQRRNLALQIGPAGDTRAVAVPLIDVGQVSAENNSALNVVETFTLSLVRGDRRHGREMAVRNHETGASVFEKPVDNIGNKTIPDYHAYAAAHVYGIDVPGCGTPGRMFVGQRKDPFVVNLGEVFDLVNLKNPIGPPDAARDSLSDKNVTSLILELPIACVANGRQVIGGWTTASLPRRMAASGGEGDDDDDFVQVSRLGMPLVNEVVIGLKDKDRFNASEPKHDAQFLTYVTHPTLPALIEILFGAAGVRAPTQFPRSDLVAVFLTGVPGLNADGSVGEMVRLNVTTPPKPAALQDRLGVIAGDVAGFPNGRRPGDDVVDIALRVVMGKLLPAAAAPSGQLPFTDGAIVNASFFDEAFPYLKDPLPGSPQSISP